MGAIIRPALVITSGFVFFLTICVAFHSSVINSTNSNPKSQKSQKNIFNLPPSGIWIDLSYSSRVVNGWGTSPILYLAADFILRSDNTTLNILPSFRRALFSALSSSIFFICRSRDANVFWLTPLSPIPAHSPHPGFTDKCNAHTSNKDNTLAARI